MTQADDGTPVVRVVSRRAAAFAYIAIEPPPIAALGFIADTDQTGASAISELGTVEWEWRSVAP